MSVDTFHSCWSYRCYHVNGLLTGSQDENVHKETWNGSAGRSCKPTFTAVTIDCAFDWYEVCIVKRAAARGRGGRSGPAELKQCRRGKRSVWWQLFITLGIIIGFLRQAAARNSTQSGDSFSLGRENVIRAFYVVLLVKILTNLPLRCIWKGRFELYVTAIIGQTCKFSAAVLSDQWRKVKTDTAVVASKHVSSPAGAQHQATPEVTH